MEPATTLEAQPLTKQYCCQYFFQKFYTKYVHMSIIFMRPPSSDFQMIKASTKVVGLMAVLHGQLDAE